jgi:hypothetical protein
MRWVSKCIGRVKIDNAIYHIEKRSNKLILFSDFSSKKYDNQKN